MKSFLHCLAITLLISLKLSAQKVELTINEQIKLQIPASVCMSSDGSFFAYSVKSADTLKSRWINSIYIFDKLKGMQSLITKESINCTNPKFSIDNKDILFLAPSDYSAVADTNSNADGNQIWAYSFTTSQAKRITADPNGIDEYVLSSDGGRIACLSDEFDKPAADKISADRKVRIDETVYPKTNPAKALNIFDSKTGKVITTIKLDAGATEIKFHPNGQNIVYQTNYSGEYNDEQKYDILSVSLETGQISKLIAQEGPETSPVYSPDGKYLAFKSQTTPDVEFAETDLCLLNTSTGKIENVTKSFDLSVLSFSWSNHDEILVLVNEGMTANLYRYSLKAKKFENTTKLKGVISEFGGTTESGIFTRIEFSDKLPEIWLNGKAVTNFSAQLEKYDLGIREIVTYPSKDSRFNIEGLLFKPKSFSPDKKYPMIVTCHGGPYGNFKNTFLQGYPIHQLVKMGYIVFAPNPRGSSGYSDKFSQANRYELGMGDYEDIMAGVDYLVNQGFVDTAKLGVMGGSYGGYMTNWIISQNNRFHAAVSLFGIFSFFTDWSNSFQPSFERMYFGYYYWERPIDLNNLYVKSSPSFYANNIKTPTLILQGEKDVYTDLSNSREMYQALHTLGVPCQFVVYPREGHGIRNEPNHYINSVGRTLRWFDSYLR